MIRTMQRAETRVLFFKSGIYIISPNYKLEEYICEEHLSPPNTCIKMETAEETVKR